MARTLQDVASMAVHCKLCGHQVGYYGLYEHLIVHGIRDPWQIRVDRQPYDSTLSSAYKFVARCQCGWEFGHRNLDIVQDATREHWSKSTEEHYIQALMAQ